MNDSPFAHRIARTTKPATPANDTRRTTPVIGRMPMTDDDLACEAEVTPAKTASPAAAPQQSNGMRQTLVAVVAFIATTLVLLLAVVVWKTVFGK